MQEFIRVESNLEIVHKCQKTSTVDNELRNLPWVFVIKLVRGLLQEFNILEDLHPRKILIDSFMISQESCN